MKIEAQIDADLKQAMAASPYKGQPTVFPHRAGRGMNPTLGLHLFPNLQT